MGEKDDELEDPAEEVQSAVVLQVCHESLAGQYQVFKVDSKLSQS